MPDISNMIWAQKPILQLSQDAVLDILYLARTNSIIDLKEDVQAHSEQHHRSTLEILQAAKDPHTGNTAVHYAAANGHLAVLSYIQERETAERSALDGTARDTRTAPQSLFSSINDQGSTPLHYAAVNGQLSAVECLLAHPGWSEEKVKKAYIEIRNHAGRTARDEADAQGAGREEWLKVVGLLEKYETDDREEPEAAGGVDGEEADDRVQGEIEKAQEGVGDLNIE